ncbi:glutamine amidotransferase subunit [Dispira parvispora]|uniref:Glutamine amidotransferase subunit n=1 Tax=Dispira parvispora TaxID=1520584 RepID=A0A9W8AS73_9FUNG|nr:glutamine amidotransferase subunit [Dispira parvispora]
MTDTPRLHKAHSEALWLPNDNVAYVHHLRGNIARTLGYTHQSKLYLHPEEALFEVERGALLLRLFPSDESFTPNSGIEISGYPMLSLTECYQYLFSVPISPGFNLSVYQTYSYLRKLGYVVIRSQVYQLLKEHLAVSSDDSDKTEEIEGTDNTGVDSPAAPSTDLLTPESERSLPFTNSAWYRGLFRNWAGLRLSARASPLVDRNTLLSSYEDLYQRLDIIPRSRLRDLNLEENGQTRPLAANTVSRSDDKSQNGAMDNDTGLDYFCVYKPSTPFKKRNIQPPDYCVFVKNLASSPNVMQPPTLAHFRHMFKIAEFPPKVALALVEYGNVMFVTVQDTLIEPLILRPDHSIIHQSFDCRLRLEGCRFLNGDGFGVGWYDSHPEEGPCIFTSTLPAWSNINLRRIAEKIHSPLVFAHVRATTGGTATSESNCHPWQYGCLMWMHNGHLAQFHKIKRRLQNSLRDELFAFIQGNTDSEWAFALFLNQLDDPLRQSFCPYELKEAMLKTIALINLWSKEAGTTQSSLLNFALTDGRTVVCTRYVSSHEFEAPSLYYSSGSRFAERNGSYRMEKRDKREDAVVVASEPLTFEKADWLTVPSNTLLLITPKHNILLYPVKDDFYNPGKRRLVVNNA